jgi:diacylglycerol kinase (ATP)
MAWLFIINPKAGKRLPRISERITELFTGRGLRFDIVFTKSRGHASELAARALIDGCTRVVAAGGDGTIRETAIPLIGKEAALGLLPCGSGNGLARNLYIPLDFGRALEGLLRWEPRPIDAGLANGKPFFCASGTGLDAEIAHDFNNIPGRRGILPYVWHGARRVLKYKPRRVTALLDGRRLEQEVLVAGVLNGMQYGGGARMAPGAYIDDGLLDLCLVRAASIPRLLLALPSLFNGRLAEEKAVYSSAQGRVIDIDCAGPAWYHLDGEDFYAPEGKLRYSVMPGALKVLAPKPALEQK